MHGTKFELQSRCLSVQLGSDLRKLVTKCDTYANHNVSFKWQKASAKEEKTVVKGGDRCWG